MPEVSRFFGIIILMYFNDHPPPHFHARYGDHKVLIDIESLTILKGSLPPRALGLVVEWGALHKEELLADWERARQQQELIRIPPLE